MLRRDFCLSSAVAGWLGVGGALCKKSTVEWVSVDERLPPLNRIDRGDKQPTSERHLVFTHGEVCTAWLHNWNGELWWGNANRYVLPDITHWAEIPDGPK